MQIDLTTDIPDYRANKFPKARFVEWTGDENVSVTAVEFVDKISQFTALFTQLDLRPGMRIATFAQSTRIDMIAAEFAVMHLGGIVCPIHWGTTPEALQNVIQNIAPKLYIVPNQKHRQAITTHFATSKDVRIVQLDALEHATTGSTSHDEKPRESHASALIISTSGTSGDAKGVVLSHQNIVFTALACAAVVPIGAIHTMLSFLPVSHILERTVLYTAILLGAEIHFADNPRHAYLLIPRVKPHYFTGVPRNLERTFMRFKRSSNQQGFFTRQIFAWSLRQGKMRSGKITDRIGTAVARRFVLRKLRRLFGRRIKGIIVGGAAMNADIIRWFDMAGIKVREGYGLSETTGVVTFNRFTPGEYKFGSVGRPLPGVEIKIDQMNGDDVGQIFVRSPSLMQGYVQKGVFEKITTMDRWFATGDTGHIDEKGFLVITGRIKDNFKNSFGQYVSPARIEKKLEYELGIDRSIVIGLQKPHTSTLIRPDFEFLEDWANSNNVHWTAAEYMVHNPDIIQYYQSIIDEINRQSQAHEHILGFALVAEEWRAENGLLTATLKLRREAIIEKYQKVIRDIYH